MDIKNLLHRGLVIVFILLFTISAKAGDGGKSDLGLWATADATYKLKKWSFTGGLEYRMNDNITKPQLYSFNGWIRYRTSKLLRLGLGYEFYANDNGRQTINVTHRLMLDAELYFNINNFKFVNRNSILDPFKHIEHPDWGMRNRLKVNYPIKKFSPFVYFETYFDFTKFTHQKNRYSVGLDFNINPKNKINFYYMVEDAPRKSFTYHILGVGYSFAIN